MKKNDTLNDRDGMDSIIELVNRTIEQQNVTTNNVRH